MDYRIEVITLPVSNVDRAVRFYTERVGFTLDVDYRPNSQFRVVQRIIQERFTRAAASSLRRS